MALINERDHKKLQDTFASLSRPVKLVYFTQRETESGIPSEACFACRETQQILEEVAGLSDKLSLEVHDFLVEEKLAQEYRLDKIPAVVIESDGRRLRYYGMPSGYEFTVLIESILDVAREGTDLSPRAKEQLRTVARPIHVQVFVTPT